LKFSRSPEELANVTGVVVEKELDYTMAEATDFCAVRE
jgi:hypothetical protein